MDNRFYVELAKSKDAVGRVFFLIIDGNPEVLVRREAEDLVAQLQAALMVTAK